MTLVSTSLKPGHDQWDWQFDGACNGIDPEAFFLEPSTRGKNKRSVEQKAIAICNTCPVRQKCLDHALKVPEMFGVWGGKTEEQRQSLVKELGIVYNATRI
jgi:WhiB family redox-sensing transcriptional regulator